MRLALIALMPIALLAAPAPAQAQVRELGDVLGQLLGVSGNPDLARCESVDGKPRTCRIEEGARVEFVRQLSKTACVQGKTMVMSSTQITVSGGCRAEFRVIRSQTATTGTQLQTAIADGLRSTLKQPSGEYGSLYEVRVQTAEPMAASSSRERIYSGNAQAIWGGRTYPLEYTARQDVQTGRFLNLDYRYSNAESNSGSSAPAWTTGSAMDAEARAALEAAIAADYRRRSGVRSVQVAVNDAYREQQVTRSDYRFTGKFGVSVNDGDWQTDSYQARVFLPRNTVSEVQLGAAAR